MAEPRMIPNRLPRPRFLYIVEYAAMTKSGMTVMGWTGLESRQRVREHRTELRQDGGKITHFAVYKYEQRGGEVSL